jgi:hypothetical protein
MKQRNAECKVHFTGKFKRKFNTDIRDNDRGKHSNRGMFNVKLILQEYSKEKVANVHQLDSSHPSVHTQAQILLRFS